MHLLTGARRSYDWGSIAAMPEFLNLPTDGEPFAELWLGAHPTGPSTVETPGGAERLDEFVSRNERRHLGERVIAGFGRLPYLVKLLAPAKPLSIQVHPTREMAEEGFHEEERRGVPVSDPQRSFKDRSNKPEMVYAITGFEGLVGFRPHEEIVRLLDAIAGPLASARELLSDVRAEDGLKLMLETMVGLAADDINTVVGISVSMATAHPDPEVRAACATVVELAQQYPGDVGAVVSLVLNRVQLEPGQLVFLGDGVPHAYLGGFGLEIMANSDNVLRLGLTSKHIDVESMLHAIDFSSWGFEVSTGPGDAVTHVFGPPVPEFALSITRPDKSSQGSTVLPGDGPRILVCLDGDITAATNAAPHGRSITKGQSLFVSAADGDITVRGNGTVAQAFVP